MLHTVAYTNGILSHTLVKTHKIMRKLLVLLISFCLAQYSFTQCTETYKSDFERDFGVWNDGGTHAARSSDQANSGGFSFRLRSDDGQASSIYSDQLTIDTESNPTLNFSYFPESMEAGEGFVVEISYDSGQNFQELRHLVAGSDFSNNLWYTFNYPLVELQQNLINLRIRSIASSTSDKVYIDDIAIQHCNDIVAGNQNSCLPGALCDDSNPCTNNDRWDEDCNCIGQFADADNDGVCDNADVCPEGDDNIDLDDNGTPDACQNVSADCIVIDKEHFEGNDPVWTSGGSSASVAIGTGYFSQRSFRLIRSSSSASSMISRRYNFSISSNPTFTFYFLAESTNNGDELFIEISPDDGISFLPLKTLTSGVDFNNDRWQSEQVELLAYGATTSMTIRVTSAVAINASIYIDQIVVEDCFGIPQQSECLPNTSCDDNNPCTSDDKYDLACNCIGVIIDSDADGVCDLYDQCPGQDDSIDENNNDIPDGCEVIECAAGEPCDDYNQCTTNDIYDENCNCSGIEVDSDNDSVCDVMDICPGGDDLVDENANGIPDGCEIDVSSCQEIQFDDLETGFGNWIDGGNNARHENSRGFNSTASIRLNDNNGAASSISSQPLNLANLNATVLEFYFIGVGIDAGESLIAEISTNGGADFQVLQTFIVNTHFTNGNWSQARISLTDVNNRVNATLRIRSNASSTRDFFYIDNIRILNCDIDILAGADCTPGQPCDDNDPCTVNDTFDIGCNCEGEFQDSDNDTVCDVFDQCLGGNDLVDENANGIPDSCEESTTGCNTDETDVDSGLGIWNLGGDEATITNEYANSGAQSILLVGGGTDETSSIYTDAIPANDGNYILITFKYLVSGYEPTDEFHIEISYDGGITFEILETLRRGVDFENDIPNKATAYTTLIMEGMILRVRSEASIRLDELYVDDILVEVCGEPETFTSDETPTETRSLEGLSEKLIESVKVYPNPAVDYTNIELDQLDASDEVRIQFYTITGHKVMEEVFHSGNKVQRIDISSLKADHLYLTVIYKNGKRISTHSLYKN